MPRNGKLAYLLKTYPKLSETFILNEILGLEKLGMKVEIFSLRQPSEPLHAAVKAVKAKVTYIPHIGSKLTPPEGCRGILAHLYFLASRTRLYLRTAYFCLSEYGASGTHIFFQVVILARYLQRERFTHIHAHFANVPTSVAEAVHRLIGISYSFTAHAKDIYLTDAAELSRKMGQAVSVLTCTAYNQRYLTGISPPSTPIHLAYHGVDVGRFNSGARLRPPDTETPLILSVGRLCEKKGFPYLIRACQRLRDRGLDFQCKIIGSGELRAELEGLIAELGVANCVTLVGQMVQEDVIEHYRMASVFVLPCLVTDDGDRDGIPNVLMEAMVSGIPVVSTRVSGITELVDHMTDGIVVEERDETAIAEGMELLLRQPELGRRLGENGRVKVLDRFALDASARRVHELLLEAVGAPAVEAGSHHGEDVPQAAVREDDLALGA